MVTWSPPASKQTCLHLHPSLGQSTPEPDKTNQALITGTTQEVLKNAFSIRHLKHNDPEYVFAMFIVNKNVSTVYILIYFVRSPSFKLRATVVFQIHFIIIYGFFFCVWLWYHAEENSSQRVLIDKPSQHLQINLVHKNESKCYAYNIWQVNQGDNDGLAEITKNINLWYLCVYEL